MIWGVSDPVGRYPQALLTMLYRSMDSLRRCKTWPIDFLCGMNPDGIQVEAMPILTGNLIRSGEDYREARRRSYLYTGSFRVASRGPLQCPHPAVSCRCSNAAGDPTDHMAKVTPDHFYCLELVNTTTDRAATGYRVSRTAGALAASTMSDGLGKAVSTIRNHGPGAWMVKTRSSQYALTIT